MCSSQMLPSAYSSPASVAPPSSLCPIRSWGKVSRVIGTETSRPRRTLQGPRRRSFNRHRPAEAWSSCPTPRGSTGRGKRQDRGERGCQPAIVSPLRVRLVLWHQASNPSPMSWNSPVSSGPGQGGRAVRPGCPGPQWPVAPASSRSCCIRGWPGPCWGRGPRAGRGAPPPR